MFKKNKNSGRNNSRNNRIKPKKRTASRKSSGVTIIKNVPVDDSGVPVQIKDHMDKKGGHPHAIMDNIDNCHVSVGLTTKVKKGHNSTNKRMGKSPLNDGKQSYMRRQACVYAVNEYANPRGGSMTQTDYDYAKCIAEKAKQKYIEKKDKKK